MTDDRTNDVRVAQAVADVVALAEELHRAADAQRVGQPFEPAPLGPVPDQVELDLRPLLPCGRDGAEQRGVVLGPVQSRHRHHHASIGRGS